MRVRSVGVEMTGRLMAVRLRDSDARPKSLHWPLVMTSRAFMTTTLAVLVLFTFADNAHSQWRTNGELLEDSSWQKTVGDFGAMLMVTNDPDGLFAAWNKPPSSDYGPNISEVSTVRRGDIVMAFIVFSG